MNAIELSRRFFEREAKGLLERQCPGLFGRMAAGVFGLGSDVLGTDDELSRDHHWGPRLNILVPQADLERARLELAPVIAKLPRSFEGLDVSFDSVLGIGVGVESLSGFLERFIGLGRAPRTDLEWLAIPAPDMLHVTAGEIFHDPSGEFTSVRSQMSYYPDNVWKRRIAHNCRAYSGYAVYCLHRAVQRNDFALAAMTTGQAVQKSLELVFLLNRRYYPYKKWLYPMFRTLPRLADILDPLVGRAAGAPDLPSRLEAFDAISEALYFDMAAQGLIESPQRFAGSPTSGLRLLERCYAELLRSLPEDIAKACPQEEQRFWELNAVDWFLTAPWDEIEHALNLTAQL